MAPRDVVTRCTTSSRMKHGAGGHVVGRRNRRRFTGLVAIGLLTVAAAVGSPAGAQEPDAPTTSWRRPHVRPVHTVSGTLTFDSTECVVPTPNARVSELTLMAIDGASSDAGTATLTGLWTGGCHIALPSAPDADAAVIRFDWTRIDPERREAELSGSGWSFTIAEGSPATPCVLFVCPGIPVGRSYRVCINGDAPVQCEFFRGLLAFS